MYIVYDWVHLEPHVQVQEKTRRPEPAPQMRFVFGHLAAPHPEPGLGSGSVRVRDVQEPDRDQFTWVVLFNPACFNLIILVLTDYDYSSLLIILLKIFLYFSNLQNEWSIVTWQWHNAATALSVIVYRQYMPHDAHTNKIKETKSKGNRLVLPYHLSSVVRHSLHVARCTLLDI